ncbi:MAG: beta-N-acetylhexosaminidase [Chlamydia sp.]
MAQNIYLSSCLKCHLALFFLIFSQAFASLSIENMTIEEKVGQLLIVGFQGKEVNKDALKLIQELHVGGIIYYNWANGLVSPQQIRILSNSLQHVNRAKKRSTPLLIAADQEGGVILRLKDGFTLLPGNGAIGRTNDLKLAESAAFIAGQEMRAVGVNYNLSPVVDINSNPKNPIIGIRAFGTSVDVVVPFAKKTLQGYQKAGVLSALKHFPGHGDVEVDSHKATPILNKSKNELLQIELKPFFELAKYADTIMTAHIMLPNLDLNNCATLSKTVLDIVRNEIGFQGVIISDSLVMRGVRQGGKTVSEIAIQALNAGCDLLLLGGRDLIDSDTTLELSVVDIEKISRDLIEAVQSGAITKERLNQAVQRILTLKARVDFNRDLVDLYEQIQSPEHRATAEDVASRALEIVRNRAIGSMDRVTLFAPEQLKSAIVSTSLISIGQKETRSIFFDSYTIFELEKACSEASKSDLTIFCSYNAWNSLAQLNLIKALSQIKKPIVLLVLRDPVDADFFKESDLIIKTFSPTAVSIEAAAKRLKEEMIR